MMKKSAGDALVAAVVADLREQHLAPDARETELLDRARAAADRIAELEKIVAVEGMTFTDKHGTVRPSPLLSEIRSTTLVLTRCLGGIQMSAGTAAKNPIKVRAGQASWNARLAREGLKDA
ncbi:MAG: hypothetical protein ACLQGN_30865 [Mycobacterium sp.]|uniref:hypothetical protein n=1 Tax=Mycobacterium sp. TaxID=1785 RepID=UPI003F96A48A